MDYASFANTVSGISVMMIDELSKTRPQEIVIITMLAVSIGIGITILIQLKKLKDRL